jgi:hypothetical protein
MEFIKISPRNFMEVLTDAIVNKKEIAYGGIGDEEIVLTGRNNQINDNYCIKNNIRVEHTANEGGTIVVQDGDIEFGFFKYNGFDDGLEVMTRICDKLKETLGDRITINSNDLFVDGKYKVGSYSSVNVGDRLIYTGCHISMSVNIEHIQNICLKEMKKIPKGLSDYGIDVYELYEYIEKVLKEVNTNAS